MKIKASKSLISSFIAITVCFTMLIGTTFAWFTDSSVSGSNVITAGNLDIAVEYTLDGESWNELDGATDIFQKGLWEPGHTEVVALRIRNNGSLALKYTANMNILKETVGKTADGKDIALSDYLTISTLVQQSGTIGDIALMLAFNGESSVAYEQISSFDAENILRSDVELLPDDTHYLIVKVDMAESVGNEANHNGTDVPSIEFGIDVLATQFTYENDSFGNQYDKDAEYPTVNRVDTWDGTADISWFLDNPKAVEFEINSAEALVGLASLLDGSAAISTDDELKISLPGDLEGKTFKLAADVDLYAEDENGEPICFNPIGSYRQKNAFTGTFDGQGHTIKNLNQNTWALDNGYYYGDLGLGLFGMLEDATVKNLTIDGASISGESAICGIISGTAYGDCTFDNITVKNSKANDYQYYAGGIVGWASGNHVYKNINIDASTTIGSQWGDFGNCNGGIIGGSGSDATILLKDCTVACRIDATNDIVSAYQWHCYRNSGMLIGNTGHTETDEAVTNAAAPNVTCENVTVIYGDWANYTYCEFAGTGYPYVRVQSGVSVDGYSNVRYGHPTDANGNAVVDDNHVHNEGEDHHLLIAFDQLFGGKADHRYCQYGIASHPGVDVIYNNK